MRTWKPGDLVETRYAFGAGLLEAGSRRENILVLDADLQRSNQTFAFGQAYPDRFFDLGIAEADMVSTAAGMAAVGFTVFAASFAMFLPGRCYDQIRLQVAYARSNVKLAGVSAGLTQGPDGASHQSFDDVGLMRQLPGMTVIIPADAEEAYQAVLAVAETSGPFYLRLGRYPTPVLFDADYRFQIGKPVVMRPGADLVLFATGIMTAKALQAAAQLEQHGLQAEVVNLHTVKPLDPQAVLPYSRGVRLAVSLEEHSVHNGLGSALAEILSSASGAPPLLRIGVPDCFGQSGLADELLEFYRLTPAAIVDAVLAHLAAGESPCR
jgi:transketolase